MNLLSRCTACCCDLHGKAHMGTTKTAGAAGANSDVAVFLLAPGAGDGLDPTSLPPNRRHVAVLTPGLRPADLEGLRLPLPCQSSSVASVTTMLHTQALAGMKMGAMSSQPGKKVSYRSPSSTAKPAAVLDTTRGRSKRPTPRRRYARERIGGRLAPPAVPLLPLLLGLLPPRLLRDVFGLLLPAPAPAPAPVVAEVEA